MRLILVIIINLFLDEYILITFSIIIYGLPISCIDGPHIIAILFQVNTNIKFLYILISLIFVKYVSNLSVIVY